jgi:hypothetical protein
MPSFKRLLTEVLWEDVLYTNGNCLEGISGLAYSYVSNVHKINEIEMLKSPRWVATGVLINQWRHASRPHIMESRGK